jgi:4-hydroxyphenylpyruvate dioxygenase
VRNGDHCVLADLADMPVTRPNRLRFALPSMALGRATAGHALEPRLREAVRVGCTGIEVFYECLVEHSKAFEGATERSRLEAAASDVGRLCRDLGLTVICLQPLFDWDSIVDRAEFAVKLEEAKFRFGLCHRLGTDLIQIPVRDFA